MDRRNFLQLSGQFSAVTLLLRETISKAWANNLPEPQPAIAPQAQAQQVAPPPEQQPAPPPQQPAPAPQPAEMPFSEEWFQGYARSLAQSPYEPLRAEIADELKDLDYVQFRSIKFRSDQAVWAKENLDARLEMFHAGYLYKDRIQIFLIENGIAKEYLYSPSLFDFGPTVKTPPQNSMTGFSGFRIHGPVNRRDKYDEYVVFQGASYFRSMAYGQFDYGLSARGLAINTAQPPGEEFPIFRSFWIEKPQPGTEGIKVYALLDSKSVTGAYKFVISRIRDTVMDVDCTLYPRQTMPYVGIAPLTSMFFLGPADIGRHPDFRSSVFDSEGLQIITGRGEHIWRPLINPQRLQFTVFTDENPKGFGLVTRDREFRDFNDLNARYEARPSLWIEPQDNWGPGSVDLIELPTGSEYNDNIVAFWRPQAPMEAGKAYRYRYKMIWCWEPPIRPNFAKFIQTRVGISMKAGWHAFLLDIRGTDGFEPCSAEHEPCMKPENFQITASQGEIGEVYYRRHAVFGGHRLQFDFHSKGVEQADIRCVLISDGKPISETWVYRWTA